MKIISNKYELAKFIINEKNLGFVPTMGAIHLGHIALIKKSISQCDKTVVSIFVNKPQFNKNSDYKNYPRIKNKDVSVLKKLKVDYLFMPKENDIYEDGYNKKIKISNLKRKLCGKFRPGHFEAVVDVVDRFIKIIKPKNVYFGEKDMQQLKIIEHYIKKNKIKTNVIGCKTVREKNGIAYSSRNLLLTKKQKIIASKICKFLMNKKNKIIKNKKLLPIIKKYIFDLGVNKIDYLELIDINKLIKPIIKKSKYRVFLSYHLGNVRLIDNI
tara:strand:+ start:5345 stop:6154 length:810 start_codon:yes stop_codon:yes gene_type:complete